MSPPVKSGLLHAILLAFLLFAAPAPALTPGDTYGYDLEFDYSKADNPAVYYGDPAVASIVEDVYGYMILGGHFNSVGGSRRHNIVRLDYFGFVYPFFDEPNGAVSCVAAQEDGKVLLGGFFTALRRNGTASLTKRRYIARLKANGKVDRVFDPRANAAVLAMAVQEDGKVLIGGTFTSLRPNGAALPTTRRYIARLNADGTLDRLFNPNANGPVHCIAIQADGKALIGGEFTALAPNGVHQNTARNRVARLNSDGTLDSGLSPRSLTTQSTARRSKLTERC